MSTDADGSIGCEHVNIDKNAKSVHADFNEGTQCVSFSFTDNSHNKYGDLEEMVYRLQLTYDEVVDVLNNIYVAGSTKGYTLAPDVYEVNDINFMLQCLLPKEVKVNFTIGDVKLKTNLTIKKTIRFTKNSFFYKILGFIGSHSGEVGDIPGFFQFLPGTYKSDKPINITGIDKLHLKCDCVKGSIVNGAREPILYSFALSSPPGHKLYKEPGIKFFKKVNNSILSHIRFYLEDDDYKPVDFNGETISFTCELIKI